MGADEDGRVADDVAGIGVAGADLLGDVGAALAGHDLDVEALGLEIALALGNLRRGKGRQRGRRRREKSDLLERFGVGARGERRQHCKARKAGQRLYDHDFLPVTVPPARSQPGRAANQNGTTSAGSASSLLTISTRFHAMRSRPPWRTSRWK